MSKAKRAAGCLLGLACGDALGRPVEFNSPKAITATYGTLDEMVGFGTHGQPAGTITDDTELALRIARSLVANDGFDGADIASRFVSWYDSGPFDIGLMTADALSRLQAGALWDEAGQVVWESRPEGSNAGNGSVMRCAPHAIAYAEHEQPLGKISERSSAITHADPRCKRGCAVLNLTIAAFLRGDESPLARALETTYLGHSNASELSEALTGLPDALPANQVHNGGYVVDALQAGLYYALDAGTAKEAIVRAVNAGNDADTVGAITGAVAGARFGADSLPEDWLAALDETEELRRLASDLTDIQPSMENP